MKRNYVSSALALIFALSLGACSKNGDKKSNTVLLTQAAWKYQIAGLDADANGSVDIEDTDYEACDKDDVTTFKTDNTGVVDEGSLKCDPTDPQTETISWQFTNGEKEIIIDGVTLKILSLDDNNLKVYLEEVVGSATLRYLFILKH